MHRNAIETGGGKVTPTAKPDPNATFAGWAYCASPNWSGPPAGRDVQDLDLSLGDGHLAVAARRRDPVAAAGRNVDRVLHRRHLQAERPGHEPVAGKDRWEHPVQ